MRQLREVQVPLSDFRKKKKTTQIREISIWASKNVIHHFYIVNHSAPCLPPKILHNHCFQFLLGITVVPRENTMVKQKFQVSKFPINLYLTVYYCYPKIGYGSFKIFMSITTVLDCFQLPFVVKVILNLSNTHSDRYNASLHNYAVIVTCSRSQRKQDKYMINCD